MEGEWPLFMFLRVPRILMAGRECLIHCRPSSRSCTRGCLPSTYMKSRRGSPVNSDSNSRFMVGWHLGPFVPINKWQTRVVECAIDTGSSVV